MKNWALANNCFDSFPLNSFASKRYAHDALHVRDLILPSEGLFQFTPNWRRLQSVCSSETSPGSIVRCICTDTGVVCIPSASPAQRRCALSTLFNENTQLARLFQIFHHEPNLRFILSRVYAPAEDDSNHFCVSTFCVARQTGRNSVGTKFFRGQTGPVQKEPSVSLKVGIYHATTARLRSRKAACRKVHQLNL